MINIQIPKRVCGLNSVMVDGQRYVVVIPVSGTFEQHDLDTFIQGENYGNDNECYHRKIQGTLTAPMTVSSYGRETPAVCSIKTKGPLPMVYNCSYQYARVQQFFGPGYPPKKEGLMAQDIIYDDYRPESNSFRKTSTQWDYSADGKLQPGYPKVTVTMGFVVPGVPLLSVGTLDITPIKQAYWRQPSTTNLPDARFDVWSALYDKCCNGVFPLDSNNIANMRDLAGTFNTVLQTAKAFATKGKSLKKYFDVENIRQYLSSDHLPPCVKPHVNVNKASDAWLAYRYAYLTTKMDIDEHRDHLASAWEIYQNWSNTNIFRMHSSCLMQDTIYNMTVTLQPKMRTEMQELWVKSKALGLQVNAVNLWDLVPFSFVADWFVPVEETLQALDNTLLFNDTHFTISLPLVSRKILQEAEVSGGTIHISEYARWQLNARPVFLAQSKHSPSTRTTICRIADGAALIVGAR